MDIDRWNYIYAAATQGIPADRVCKNAEEREWYRQIIFEVDMMEKHGIATGPVSEYEG